MYRYMYVVWGGGGWDETVAQWVREMGGSFEQLVSKGKAPRDSCRLLFLLHITHCLTNTTHTTHCVFPPPPLLLSVCVCLVDHSILFAYPLPFLSLSFSLSPAFIVPFYHMSMSPPPPPLKPPLSPPPPFLFIQIPFLTRNNFAPSTWPPSWPPDFVEVSPPLLLLLLLFLLWKWFAFLNLVDCHFPSISSVCWKFQMCNWHVNRH